MSQHSPGRDWCADIRLQRGSLKEREAEARRQGVVETWETKARRDNEPEKRRRRTPP